jgi:hypothetical protein
LTDSAWNDFTISVVEAGRESVLLTT